MGLIFQKESFKSIFLQQWSRYVPAIIQYAEQSPRKSVKRKITLEGQCTVNHFPDFKIIWNLNHPKGVRKMESQ